MPALYLLQRVGGVRGTNAHTDTQELTLARGLHIGAGIDAERPSRRTEWTRTCCQLRRVRPTASSSVPLVIVGRIGGATRVALALLPPLEP
jgi:hypothetical protein